MVDKRVFRLIALFSVTILLSGCLFGGVARPSWGTVNLVIGSGSGPDGPVEIIEIAFKGNENLLLYLGDPREEVVELRLNPGTWQISGLWRRADGSPTAFSQPITVQVSRGKELTVYLAPTSLSAGEAPVLPGIEGLTGTAKNGRVTLSWVRLAVDLPVEVYRRQLDDSLWLLVDSVPADSAEFIDENPKVNAEQSYAVRIKGTPFPGPLSEPLSVFVPEPWAVLTGTIAIEYELPIPAPNVHMQNGLQGQAVHAAMGEEWDSGLETGELAVHFPEESSFAQRHLLFAQAGLELMDEIPEILVAVGVPMEGKVPNTTVLEEAGCVVEPHGRVMPLDLPVDDPLYPLQWNLPLVSLPEAWKVVQGSRTVRIAVIDSGIDAEHPDLAGRVDAKTAYSFVSNESPLTDGSGHGTHVAGIIGALTNNGQGVAGVMWDVQLVPIKVFSDSGGGAQVATVAKAILYAAGLSDEPKNPEPCQIINLSLGAVSPESTLEKAIERVRQETDVLLIASSGNDGTRSLRYPAAYEGVIAVGSVVYDDNEIIRVARSNYGPGLDLVAPGGNTQRPILSTVGALQNSYGYMHGTSMAAPHVSGVAGLMLAAGIPPSEIPGILFRSAIDLGRAGWDEEFGYGLLNANWAVRGIDRVQVMVGERIGNQIREKAQTEVLIGEPLTGLKVPVGEYQVFALIDLGEPGILDEEDYLFESDPIRFDEGQEVNLDMVLRPVKRDP